jgi:glycosyltransferase involved in cell wall biosynthesis
MNILLVNHYAGHPKMGMEYRPFYFARSWQAQGHRVDIVSASFSHVRQVQPKTHHWHQMEALDGVNYHWLKTPSYSGNGFWRLLNMLTFLIGLFRLGRKWTEKIDVVIASSTYPLDIYLCRWLARKYSAQLVFEVHDLWPLSPIELGGISKYHPLMLLFQHAEDFAYKHADLVVSILPCALEHMKARGLVESKYIHIPNGIEVNEWDESQPCPAQHTQLVENLKAKGAFVVAYAGAIGVANDLDSLVNSAGVLDQQNTNIHIVIIGQGPEKPRLQELVRQKGLANVHFLPPVNKTQIPSLLKQFDCLYIGLKPQPLFRFGVSPNKLMDYMMAARPIVWAINSGNHPVKDAQCGIEVSAGDANEIAQAFNRICQLPKAEQHKLGDNGLEYATTYKYSRLAEVFINKIIKS